MGGTNLIQQLIALVSRLFGTGSVGNGVLGGLLQQGMDVARNKITEESIKRKSPGKGMAMQAAEDRSSLYEPKTTTLGSSVIELIDREGRHVATWFGASRRMVTGAYKEEAQVPPTAESFVFLENGDVVRDGRKVGSLNEGGRIVSEKLPQGIRMNASGYMFFGDERVGFVSPSGMVNALGQTRSKAGAQVSDWRIPAWYFMAGRYTVDEMGKEKERVERTYRAEVAMQQEAAAANASRNATTSRAMSATDRWSLNGTTLWLNGNRMAEIKGNNICDSTDFPIAELRSDGDVVAVGKGVLGRMRSNGDCEQTGRGLVYSMRSDGTLWVFAGGKVGELNTFNLAAAAYIFLIYGAK